MDFRDLAVAARVLRKSPVFALTAALTIALGVGASTAIFSVTNAVLLRPLPYHHPDRLVVACTDTEILMMTMLSRILPFRRPAPSSRDLLHHGCRCTRS